MTQTTRSIRFRLAIATGLATVLAAAAGPGFAQSSPAQPAPSQAQTAPVRAETVVVLGTRRTDRSVTTSAAPVDVISAADLSVQPSANVIESIKNIVPSFFVGQNTIADAGTFVRAPNLRGLPGDQVLVMINGKRFNRAALVQTFAGGDTALSFGSHAPDISSIPSIAIANLQILRDGATSQYGSDAIAGVMNFGLKTNSSGLLITGRYGQSMEKDDGASATVAFNWGLPLGENGFLNISGEYNDEEGTSRGARRPAAILFEQQNPSLANRLPGRSQGLPDQIWGSSPSFGWKAVVNAGYDLSETAQIYAFLNASSTEADQSFNFRQTNTGTAVNANGEVRNLPAANAAFRNTFFQTPCPANNATCPAGGFILDNNRFDFRSIYPAGFTPRFVGVTESFSFVAGVKGELASGLTYDVSGTLSENSLDLSMYDSLNASFGPASKTSFEYGAFRQKLENFNIDLTYPMEVGLAGPLTLAGGLEWRKESFTVPAGELQSYAAGPYANPQRLFTQVSPGVFAPVTTLPAGVTNIAVPPASSGYAGTPPANAGTTSQSNYAIYIDLEADVTERLSGGIAARFEDYDTFGSTTVGKISALYKVSDTFSIRGSVGTGFQAPSPGQANLQTATTNFVAGNQVQEGIFPVSSGVARYYGSQPLKPAEATNYGLGFVFEPNAATTITVDAYQIDVTNRIFITQNFAVTAADLAAQPVLSLVGVGGAVRYFTNGLDTSTRGLDIVATHNTELFGARLSLTAAYNRNENEVTRANRNVISRAQTITIENLAPKDRLNLSSNWQWDRWTVNARAAFFGEWQTEIDYPGQVFGAKTTVDLDVSYDITDNYTVTVGAQNLLNEFPDRIAQCNTPGCSVNVFPISGGLADGQVYPRSGGPFGMNGGFWYVSLRANF
jgi:iron complex outermembrane recepter protein